MRSWLPNHHQHSTPIDLLGHFSAPVTIRQSSWSRFLVHPLHGGQSERSQWSEMSPSGGSECMDSECSSTATEDQLLIILLLLVGQL